MYGLVYGVWAGVWCIGWCTKNTNTQQSSFLIEEHTKEGEFNYKLHVVLTPRKRIMLVTDFREVKQLNMNALLCHRGPIGEHGGDLLDGNFWIAEDSVSGLLSWTQSTLRF
jgi:hypothetical protein